MPTLIARRELAERIIADAEEDNKAKQKLKYDENHYDVEFQIGSHVLWFCDDQKDK